MLVPDLGEVTVAVNGLIQQFQAIKLDNRNKRYVVDGRYKIIVNLGYISDTVSITCTLTSRPFTNIIKIIESGERLALISFYRGKTKLSIGVEEGRPETVCEYLENGIKIIVNRNAGISDLEFYVAWVAMQDQEKEDIFTWFAADPTLS